MAGIPGRRPRPGKRRGGTLPLELRYVARDDLVAGEGPVEGEPFFGHCVSLSLVSGKVYAFVGGESVFRVHITVISTAEIYAVKFVSRVMQFIPRFGILVIGPCEEQVSPGSQFERQFNGIVAKGSFVQRNHLPQARFGPVYIVRYSSLFIVCLLSFSGRTYRRTTRRRCLARRRSCGRLKNTPRRIRYGTCRNADGMRLRRARIRRSSGRCS